MDFKQEGFSRRDFERRDFVPYRNLERRDFDIVSCLSKAILYKKAF